MARPLLLLLALSGCVTANSRAEVVARRARFDLNCDKPHVNNLGGHVFGAAGCGRRATYIVKCRSKMSQGSCTAEIEVAK